MSYARPIPWGGIPHVTVTFLVFLVATWCPDTNELELERKKLQIIEQKYEAQREQINILKRNIDELKGEITDTNNKQKREEYASQKLPYIYVITPTKIRLEQKADLTRLSHTLRLVPNLHWIVIEDSPFKTPLVENFLANCKVSYTHLFASTPEVHRLKETDPNWLKPRGVPQRNAGIKWLREKATKDGVVYFADDDNTYDLRVFDEVSSELYIDIGLDMLEPVFGVSDQVIPKPA